MRQRKRWAIVLLAFWHLRSSSLLYSAQKFSSVIENQKLAPILQGRHWGYLSEADQNRTAIQAVPLSHVFKAIFRENNASKFSLVSIVLAKTSLGPPNAMVQNRSNRITTAA